VIDQDRCGHKAAAAAAVVTIKCFKFKDILKDRCMSLDASSVTNKNNENVYHLMLLQTAMIDQAHKDTVSTP